MSGVHEHVFRGSIRHILPFPLLFKAIEFDKALATLEIVSDGLEHCAGKTLRMSSSCAGEQEEYLTMLFEYLQSLIATVNLLERVLKGLQSKSLDWKRYSWRAYRDDVAKYKASTDFYVALGGPLNEKLQALRGQTS